MSSSSNSIVTEVALATIRDSPTNPRKHFDQAKLDELTESVRVYGILQPIMLRPKGKGRYELVAGHRRFRAAKAAGLKEIPACIRDLDDKQTLEIQVIENLQRADLHPMEEAEGYESLIKMHGYTAETLAHRIGKSPSYVYARLKLTALCEAGRKAVWADQILPAAGVAVARIPDEDLQKKAVKWLLDGNRHGQPVSVRNAVEHIEREYMLRLQDARWKLNDETLVPAAGPCTTCPHRTGNQLELSGAPSKADLCTKPKCFAEKRDAEWARTSAAAMSKGQRVLTTAEARKAVSNYSVTYNGPFVDANEVCIADEKGRTYGKLLAKTLTPALARAENGRVWELFAREDLAAAFRDAGHTFKPEAVRVDDYTKRQKEEGEKRKVERAIEKAVCAELMPRLAELPLNDNTLRLITLPIAVSHSYRLELYCKRHGLPQLTSMNREDVLGEHVLNLNAGQMLALIFESLLTFSPTEVRQQCDKSLPAALCQLVGVDAAAIENEIRDAVDERKQKKEKKAELKSRALKAKAHAAVASAAVAKGKGSGKKAKAARESYYLSLLRQLAPGQRNTYKRLKQAEGLDAAITKLEVVTKVAPSTV